MDNLEVPQALTDNPDTQQVPIDQPNNPEGQQAPTDNHDNPPPPLPVASTSKTPDTGNQGNAGTGAPTKTMIYTKRWTAVVQDTKEAINAVHEAAKVVYNKQGQLQTALEALAEKVDAKTYLNILKANQFLTLQTDQQIFSDETYRQAIVRHP